MVFCKTFKFEDDVIFLEIRNYVTIFTITFFSRFWVFFQDILLAEEHDFHKFVEFYLFYLLFYVAKKRKTKYKVRGSNSSSFVRMADELC